MSDGATSFGAAAAEYDRARPEYPAEAVAWMVPSHAVDVVDVGAGTGKLTSALLARLSTTPGSRITAIDPDSAMLSTLSAGHPRIPTFVGTAEHLPLDDASADLITFGQAWHWVDPPVASREVARVLRPGGTIGLIWNIRDETVPWVKELGETMQLSNAELLIAEGGPIVGEPFGALETAEFTWESTFTVDRLVELAASRSYVITATDQRRAEIFDGVRALGERVADADGSLTMPYRTHVYRSTRP
ncbi:class I SAM-dependent methyltransferase [soil metagenome]